MQVVLSIVAKYGVRQPQYCIKAILEAYGNSVENVIRKVRRIFPETDFSNDILAVPGFCKNRRDYAIF